MAPLHDFANMIVYKLLWKALVLPVICFSQLLRIRLDEPLDSSTYAIRNAGDTTSATIKYEIYSHPEKLINSAQLCALITAPHTNKQLLPLTCFTVNEGRGSKIIDGLSRGSYSLTLTLQDDTAARDTLTSIFYVEEVQSLLPKLSILNSTPRSEFSEQGTIEGGISIVASASSDSSLTDVSVEYSLGNTILQMDDYEVCVHVMKISTDIVVLQLSCLPTSQKQFTIQELSRGSYALYLTLADRRNGDALNSNLFPTTQTTTNIHVNSITKSGMMPYFTLTSETIEIGLYSSDDTSDVTVECPVKGIYSAVRQVQVCVQVNSVSDGQDTVPVVPLTCLNSGQKNFVLRKLNVGEYDVKMILRLFNSPHTQYAETEDHKRVDIRVSTEMLPSYNWQPLHAWHSIPGGIQTRLPLGSSGRKEAKIPEPWQLQLSMPSPCKYFLRMSVDRRTTVSQILEAAGKQCKMDSSSFVLTADGEKLFDVLATMESTDFFNTKHGLLMVAD